MNTPYSKIKYNRNDLFRVWLIRKLPWWLMISLVIIFIAWQLSGALIGPTLNFDDSIYLNSFNNTDKNGVINVSGVAQRVAFVYLNGEEESIFADNSFSYKLYPSPGYHIIDIKVADRYGRSRTYNLEIYNPNLKTDYEIAQIVELVTASVQSPS